MAEAATGPRMERYAVVVAWPMMRACRGGPAAGCRGVQRHVDAWAEEEDCMTLMQGFIQALGQREERGKYQVKGRDSRWEGTAKSSLRL